MNINKDDEDSEINENQIREINLFRSKSSLIIYPDSSTRNFIDAFSFMLLLIISIYIPFIIAFTVDTTGPFAYFELFLDIWFLSEILTNFFTGYYDKGILIMNKLMISKAYLKSWFIVDIISSAPLLIIQIVNQNE